MSFNSFRLDVSRFLAVAALTGIFVVPTRSVAQDVAAAARRTSDIASIAVSEYAQGVTDGQIVVAVEYGEATTFLGEARAAAGMLGAAASARVLPLLDSLAVQMERRVPESRLRATLAALRDALEAVAGVPLDPMPDKAVSLKQGQRVYAARCAQCHGATGRGDGATAAALDPKPADLTDTSLTTRSPVAFFRKINVGVSGTAMPPFGGELDLLDRWSVALYASLLRHPVVEYAPERKRVEAVCPTCLLWLSDLEFAAMISDDSLAALLGARAGDSLAHDSSVLAFARAAPALEVLGGDRRLAARRIVRRTREVLSEADALAARGEFAAASRRVTDSYLAYEGIETPVRARDAAVATRTEQAFAAYRAALTPEISAERRGAARTEVDAALNASLATVTAEPSVPVLFAQSFIILVREGLEAILVIGALAAVLVKAGAPERKREMGWGVAAAVVASGLTALAFATLFRSAARHQELLEGGTMLLAALVLFWVSYWLVSKVELAKWMAFVRGQIGQALSSGRGWALAAIAFLAVYREGFETVLFYAALFSNAAGAAGDAAVIIAGIVAGAVVLGGVYYAMQRFGVRLPLKPFFGVTSGLLYLMAFSFAGKGVAELQEAGVISITPLKWMPSIPFLGIFPTIQTFASQAVLLLAILGALVWVFWLAPKPRQDRQAA